MKYIQEVRILIDIDPTGEDEFGALIDAGHEWLQQNIKNAVDWQTGAIYPEDDAPLQ